MTPERDPEWESWTAAWNQGDGEAAAELLRRQVERRRRRDIVQSVLDTALAVGITATSAWFAWRDPQPWRVAWAATIAAFFAAALLLALWNRRGTFRPASQSLRGFLDLSALHARRTLRLLRFLPWFLAAESIAVLALLRIYGSPGAVTRGALLLAAVFAGLGLRWRWLRRRTRDELATLAAARRELDD
jgi:hypothetical protein